MSRMPSGRLKFYIVLICVVYVLVINLIGFAMMGIDKDRSRREAWRISEANLFVVAILGGSIGSIAGMLFFHHKTKHPAFFIGMPLIFILQLAFIIWFFLSSPFEILIL